ncbi:MAG: glycosyltransferase family 2 protein [Planctomycetaceae bacterium]|jgi:glycosyltransferase involved in cell wall biosynthesis|nr:glycosyltransferase family 2 protein [Planctomycetaceae bacterium]
MPKNSTQIIANTSLLNFPELTNAKIEKGGGGTYNSQFNVDVIDNNDFVEISVVTPAFNESENLSFFVESVSVELDKVTDSWEVIFVDDGSSDNSLEVLRDLCAKDDRIKVICLARNFGNQAAASAGLKFSRGRAVIVMDSDMQHPPELISKMVQHWRDGYHCVYTIRDYGDETGKLKRYTSSLFSRVMNYFSKLSMPDGLSDFRLLDRKVVDYVNMMEENSRFLRAMIFWLGFKQINIPFTANPRLAGKTKFSLTKLFKLSLDSLTSFSVMPLRWITYTGTFVALCSIFYAGYILFEVMMSGVITPGFPTLIVAILFLGGVQIMSIGIVGEYVGRIYMETKRRPLFVIQEKYGFDHKHNENYSEENDNNNNEYEYDYDGNQIKIA